jgi:hypothetical protein
LVQCLIRKIHTNGDTPEFPGSIKVLTGTTSEIKHPHTRLEMRLDLDNSLSKSINPDKPIC